MIYFIQDSRDSRIKIGVSRNPWERLAALTVGASGSLELLAVMDGDRNVERGLHKRFSDMRIAGEWFRPGADILAIIERAKAAFPQHKREEPMKPEKRPIEAELATIRQDSPHWLLEMELGFQLSERRRLRLPTPSNAAELLDGVNVGGELRAMTDRLKYLIEVVEFRHRHGYPSAGMRFAPPPGTERGVIGDCEAFGDALKNMPGGQVQEVHQANPELMKAAE